MQHDIQVNNTKSTFYQTRKIILVYREKKACVNARINLYFVVEPLSLGFTLHCAELSVGHPGAHCSPT